MNEGLGKDFNRKGNSVKRSGPFSEPPDSENSKVAGLIPFPKISSNPNLSSAPRCGSSPDCRLEGPPPPPPPFALGPLPPTSLGRPLPEPCKKSQGGVGGRGKERAGREGGWLEGRVLQLQWGMGGDPPNTSWGQTHIGSYPNLANYHLIFSSYTHS